MSTYLTSYPASPFDEENPQPGNVIYSQTYNDGVEDRLLYLSAEDMSVDYPTDARVIGHWANGGVLTGNVHADYEIIRPFGNKDTGEATDKLEFHHFQGHSQREMQAIPEPNTYVEYPPETQPLQIIFDYYWYDQAGFSGWGWLAEITGDAVTRDPTARAPAWYSDPEWQNYVATTGAFQQGPSRLGQVDENGDPLTVWYAETPAGWRTPDKTEWNLCILYGSLQEGCCHLVPDVATERVTLFFWDRIQGEPKVGESWVDSGATTDGMAGTVTLVSDVAPFSVGSQVRIDGIEMTITSIWNTQGLELDPYQVSATGLPIWVWQ